MLDGGDRGRRHQLPRAAAGGLGAPGRRVGCELDVALHRARRRPAALDGVLLH